MFGINFMHFLNKIVYLLKKNKDETLVVYNIYKK